MWSAWLQPLLIFAEAQNAAGKEKAPGLLDGLMSMAPMLLVLFLLFYFLMIRPQSKERQKRQEMLGNVKKNDRVLTIGGIYGVVMNVHKEADEVILKVDEANNTKLRVSLTSIARVVSGTPGEDAKSS
ncbi:MAG: preprotein translocase subunit YajC [Pirellulales bacterium]|nr:preprotein translocase subunit YajC [Pirellulales bacterium]